MCQLFALTSPQPISPDFSLRGFFQRGGNTGEHADGWGLALFHSGETKIHTHVTAAHSCSTAREILHAKPRATTVLAHIRKATAGAISTVNTHPFMRELWGESWLFAHNGDLKEFYPELNGCFQPLGQTDSERAFCLLCTELEARFPSKPAVNELAEFLQERSAEIAKFGTFNFLLSNGNLLFAHCSTELYWTCRKPPFGKIQLVDVDFSIDLAEINRAEEQMFVIATKPLTRGEPWSPMGRGELRVFQNGDMIIGLLPTPSTPAASLDWNRGWQSQQIVIS